MSPNDLSTSFLMSSVLSLDVHTFSFSLHLGLTWTIPISKRPTLPKLHVWKSLCFFGIRGWPHQDCIWLSFPRARKFPGDRNLEFSSLLFPTAEMSRYFRMNEGCRKFNFPNALLMLSSRWGWWAPFSYYALEGTAVLLRVQFNFFPNYGSSVLRFFS